MITNLQLTEKDMPKVKKVFLVGKVRTQYTYATPTIRVAEVDNGTGQITYHIESKLFDNWTAPKENLVTEFYGK